VYTGGRDVEHHRSFGTQAALALVAVVVIALFGWMIAGTIVAFLHTIELFVVAAVAGWVGYRIGRHRGRPDASRR
jgi:hypothetical protein